MSGVWGVGWTTKESSIFAAEGSSVHPLTWHFSNDSMEEMKAVPYSCQCMVSVALVASCLQSYSFISPINESSDCLRDQGSSIPVGCPT